MALVTNDLSLSENAQALADALRTQRLTHATDPSGHNLASQTKAGFMSPVDKAKLDALGGGAGDIGAGEITTVHLANSAVTTEKIAAGVTITGSLIGQASSALKDSEGNVIHEVYATIDQLAQYALESDVEQWLAGKVDTSTYNGAISTINTNLGKKADAATVNTALAAKADADEVEEALAGKQAKGDYVTSSTLTTELAKKQPVGSYATKTELQQGLAEKQPAGDYVLASTHESDLAGKQPKGDYVTASTLTTELAKKQNAGSYATTAQLAEKQDKGDYATSKELEDGLATKQAAGDYATKGELDSGLAGKQPVGNYVTDTELEQAIAGVQVTDGSITVNKWADVIDLGGLS